MEQREMNTNIEYEQLTLRANSLREELHTIFSIWASEASF
jgi:kinetochore protein NDC80